MRIIGKVSNKKEDEEKPEEEKLDENRDSLKISEGKIDVAKKYGLSGPVLSQDKIDDIVKKYKRKK